MELSENDIARVTEIARGVLTEMDSDNFCSCYDGDIDYIYNDGVADFVEKFTERLKVYQEKK